jgi:hypothetical protein
MTASDQGDAMRKIRCKRIIDGKTYNTETATEILGRRESEEQWERGDYLFQTRHGAFFRYTYLDGACEDDFERIIPFSPDEACKWLEESAGYDPDLIERLFGEMPEAGSGEVKFTLRMPESLRNRLAEKAGKNKQSLNAWMVRCLETCASDGEAT